MCCDLTHELNLPPAAIEALARYRALRRERGWDWGDDRADMFRWMRFSAFGPVLERFAEIGDWPASVRAVIGDDVPAGIVVVHIDASGDLQARTGPARPVIAGCTSSLDVVVDSGLDVPITASIADREVTVPAAGVAIETLDLDGMQPTVVVRVGDRAVAVDEAVEAVPAARLQLSSAQCSRWSVVDATGGAWFPDDVLPKWDVHHRPFFHGHDVSVAVPATPVRVTCTRGVEFDVREVEVEPIAGQTTAVDLTPSRLFDPATAGWYGGDLHIHMNYSGDLVCSPEDAARMQLGEGLHLANLVAGNSQTSLVYDRELLEESIGVDLPWSGSDTVARMGVEYRNDLLGHVHALGPSASPSRYYSGHERSDHPYDSHPNADVCRELRQLDATVGYPHPAFTPFPDDWSVEQFFASPRSVEARELVADAALGLVDSVDVISPFDDEGAAFLYHRLLSCGLRLAATAGTDVFLSFSHGPGVASNPPGWGRVYANLGGAGLSVAAFKDAIRAGRTIVTNGPWIELEVDGRGPGAVIDATAGDRLVARASVTGPGVDRLTIVGPDGVVAEHTSDDPLEVTATVDGPLWLAAIARGAAHPRTLDASVFAHTSPVYVDVDGQRVIRRADARWCLSFLDRLEAFVGEHARFDEAANADQLGDIVAVLNEARAFYRGVVTRARR